MTRGTPSVDATVAARTTVPRARDVLGRAFTARVRDCTRLVAELEAAAGIPEPSDRLAARRRRTRDMASRMVARWLITDLPPSLAEVTFVSELGQLAAGEGIPIADMTRSYMMWRDANLRVMSEEIARLGTPPDIAEMALMSIRVSSDRSIVRMTRAFDAETRNLRAELEHAASHDLLTGLPNRALFMDRLNQALKRTRREVGSKAAVLFVDLDRFKDVNDGLGHASGDKLLVIAGRRLVQSIRTIDTAGRLGGDEFAVIIEGIKEAEDATAVTERILISFSRPVRIGPKSIPTTASVGVAIADGSQDAAELLQNADLAMYSAKTTGRGKCVIFEPGCAPEADRVKSRDQPARRRLR